MFSERDFAAMRQLVIHLPNASRVKEFCIIKTSQLPTFPPHPKKKKRFFDIFMYKMIRECDSTLHDLTAIAKDHG